MRTELISLAIAAAALPGAAAAQEPPASPAPAAKPPKTVGEVVVTGQAPAVQTSIDRRSYSVSGDLQAQTGAPVLRERLRTDFDTRQVRVGLTWTFGGGRQRDPGFEFQNGAAAPQ